MSTRKPHFCLLISIFSMENWYNLLGEDKGKNAGKPHATAHSTEKGKLSVSESRTLAEDERKSPVEL
ncbi:MAG: hypothetical protein R2941_07985 [Desulfobacterales bacterium]